MSTENRRATDAEHAEGAALAMRLAGYDLRTDEERERQAESETEPTGCYRALAWIRGKGAR